MSWKIDPAHSEINFSARHMMIATVRGQFEKFDGTVDFNENKPTHSSVEVQIDASSINTREPQRDAHLKSPDFLNSNEYPFIVFKSKSIEMRNDNQAFITGDLTIRDMTREVVLEVEFAGKAQSSFGTTNAGFSASTHINRKDWGLTWNVALETGGVLVGDEIKINIDLEIIKQAEPEQEAALA
jgi:polyisoprenoid-binding protein YceI